ncbi:hypothetical protein CHS0354_035268 [Potamilus streckersoni]|uniref:glutamate--cysteine ligase n=1 Tax=Potamilus streckersoni TaxID=2493646 RepID=A0AAE0S2P2_9BIVA|nr:hypothetical protein CHS0354_035268 [Potamilus streckersoni]
MTPNVYLPLLSDYFHRAEKKNTALQIGLELELIGFQRAGLKRLNTDDIQIIFKLSKLSVEPGLQLEFSTNPHTGLREIEAEKNDWFWLCVGYDPFSRLTDVPWNPKKRYAVMRRYLPGFGAGILRMMQGTAGAQVSLDYRNEADMIRKMRVSSAVAMIVGALFNNSCFAEGKPDTAAVRSGIWNDVDPRRSGYANTFSQDFGYESHIRHILDIPMLTLKKNGEMRDYAGYDFKTYLSEQTTYDEADWKTQMSVTFPFSRLRNTIETRTADSGNTEQCMALCAFWKGLLYSETALTKAYTEISTYDISLLENIRRPVASDGLSAVYQTFSIRDKAGLFVSIAEQGLADIARMKCITCSHSKPLSALENPQVKSCGKKL